MNLDIGMNPVSEELKKGREILAYHTYFNYAENWVRFLSAGLTASWGIR
jgi:hypothetical protein